MSNVRVRGCCCGIPFGCGVLVFALLVVCFWKLVVPGDFWSTGAVRGLALLAVPGVVLALRAGSSARRG